MCKTREVTHSMLVYLVTKRILALLPSFFVI